MNRKLASLDREVNGPWGRGRGHEFHYSSLIDTPPGPYLWQCSDAHGHQSECGGIQGKVFGSYIHLYFADNPELLQSILKQMQPENT